MWSRGALAPLLVGLLALAPVAVHAEDAQDAPASDHAELQALKAEVESLKAEVATLRAEKQAATIATLPSASDASSNVPAAGASTTGRSVVSLVSGDGEFSAALHTILQLDGSDYDQAGPGALASDFRRDGAAVGSPGVDFAHARQLKDGTLFRRARIGVDGTAFGDFSYRIMFDFAGAGTEDAGQLYEGWVQYNGLSPAHIRVGAFRPSSGLEDQTSPNSLLFLERPAATDVAVSLAASDTRTAAQAFAYSDRWFVSGALTGRLIGVLNTGTATPTAQTFGDQLGVVGRLAGSPLVGDGWRLHLGVHGSYLIQPPDLSGPSVAGTGATLLSNNSVAFSDTPELRVDGTRLINTGAIDARHAETVGSEAALQWKSFLVQSELEHIGVERSDVKSDPAFNGWYVEGSWVITGEPRVYTASTAAFDGPKIAHPFGRDGGWGAWELGLRYSDMDLNYDAGAPGTLPSPDAIRGGDQRIAAAEVNWYMNSLLRVMLQYQHVTVVRLSPCTLATATSCSTVWFTPVGAEIGQTYDTLSARLQFAF